MTPLLKRSRGFFMAAIDSLSDGVDFFVPDFLVVMRLVCVKQMQCMQVADNKLTRTQMKGEALKSARKE